MDPKQPLPNVPLPPPSYTEILKEAKTATIATASSEAIATAAAAAAAAATTSTTSVTASVEGQQQPVVVVINQPQQFGEYPQIATCPICRAQVTTEVERKLRKDTIVSAIVLAIFCCCCLSWAPFCSESSHDHIHSCPNCKKPIGKKIYTVQSSNNA